MWAIDNSTSFGAAGAWLYLPDGRLTWTVAIKARYILFPDGSLEPSTTPIAPLRAPVFWGDPLLSSLHHDAELIPPVGGATDVVVLGNAYAPNGEPVRELGFGFSVGSIRKVLIAIGDRIWERGKMSPPKPFTQMPVTYERAYGGKCPEDLGKIEQCNPVGTGNARSSRSAEAMKLPNIEHIAHRIESWRDQPPPVGLGPIPAHWKPRCEFAGTFDKAWQQTRAPLPPLDQQPRYFRCAPIDQQVDEGLKGGESVLLHHLSPNRRLEFSLPLLKFELSSSIRGHGRLIHAPATLNRVVIEPVVDTSKGHGLVTLIWLSALEATVDPAKLHSTQIAVPSARH